MKHGSSKIRWLTLLLVVNLVIIWGNSLLPGETSARISGFVADLLSKLLGADAVGSHTGRGLLRKAAHFAEFACLGMLTCGQLIKKTKNHKILIIYALLGCLLVACMDETIQIFVAGRGSSLLDVWIDFSGAAVGMAIALCGHYYFKSKKTNQNTEETK